MAEAQFGFMTKDFQIRFSAVTLAVLTVAAAIFAFLNFQKEQQFETPFDGVWWSESHDGIEARRVDSEGPGAKAGIKEGDLLVAINDRPVRTIADVTRSTYRIGVWSKGTYSLTRDNVPLDVPLVLVPLDKSMNAGLRFIALVYLGIGLYVLLRRWTAPKSAHFYLFCLVSFIFYAFKYTGKLNQFDWIVYWSNVVAGMLQPALFLHFVLTFPEGKDLRAQAAWLLPLVYAAGGIAAGVCALLAMQWPEPSEQSALEPGPVADVLPGGALHDARPACCGTPISTPARRSCASR